MDKQTVQPSRVVDLAGYVPEFLREIREFQQLYGAQENELKRLYAKVDELWKDSLIPTATALGIKRFESMIGLKPYPGDTLEERRASVSLKWNQQLPYTLPRLRERLEVVVGSGGYELRVMGSTYEMELQVIDQPYRVLQNLRDMTRQMIPANLVFIFAGKYPVEIPVEISAEGRLKLVSDFYARYNREFLYLNGSWSLDGTYKLNGYKELANIDLYPLVMTIRGACDTMPDTFTTAAYCMDIRAPAKTDNVMGIRSAASETPLAENKIHMGTAAAAGPGVDLTITAEKDLWYLDGSYLLDGTKLLDAEIIKYE